MALTPLEEMLLQRRQRLYGPIATSDEALNQALKAEEICQQLAPFDPCFPRFKEEQIAYEDLALLLEKAAA